jgi:single-stranded-DNA-specific exonuclease
MSMKKENIAELQKRLNSYAEGILTDEDLVPQLNIDAVVTSKTLGLKLIDELKHFEPFGEGNRKPVFVTKGLILLDEPMVMKDKHLKIRLADESGKPFEAVWWDGVAKSAGQTLRPKMGIELAYTAEANVWNGNTRLQLVVEDLRADN